MIDVGAPSEYTPNRYSEIRRSMAVRVKKRDEAVFDVSGGGSITVNTDVVVNSPSFKSQVIRARRLVKDGKIDFDVNMSNKITND